MEASHILVPVCLFVAVFTSAETRNCVDEQYNYSCDFLDPEEYGVCSIRGDPHLTTFDGVKYRFSGDCSYILVDFCDNEDTLQINANFKQFRNHETKTYASGVTVVIDGTNYTLSEDGVSINSVQQDEEEDLPYAKDENNVEIFKGNDDIWVLRVCDDNGDLIFRVGYNKRRHIIKIFASRDDFFEQLCGMCGYYNDKDSDDLKKSKNKIKSKKSRTRRMTGSTKSSTPSGSRPGGSGPGGSTKTKSSRMGKTVQSFGKSWEIDGSCPSESSRTGSTMTGSGGTGSGGTGSGGTGSGGTGSGGTGSGGTGSGGTGSGGTGSGATG